MVMTYLEADKKLGYYEASIYTYLGVAQAEKKDIEDSFKSWASVVEYIKTLALTKKQANEAILMQIRNAFSLFEKSMDDIYSILSKSKNLGEDTTKIQIKWTLAKNRVKEIKNLAEAVL